MIEPKLLGVVGWRGSNSSNPRSIDGFLRQLQEILPSCRRHLLGCVEAKPWLQLLVWATSRMGKVAG